MQRKMTFWWNLLLLCLGSSCVFSPGSCEESTCLVRVGSREVDRLEMSNDTAGITLPPRLIGLPKRQQQADISTFQKVASTLCFLCSLLSRSREKLVTLGDWGFYARCVCVIGTVVAAVQTSAFLFRHSRMIWVMTKSLWSAVERAAVVILCSASNTEFESDYVDRPKEEQTLRAAFNFGRDPDGSYVILYGPRASGKSTLVRRIVRDRKDVVIFSIGNVFSPEQVFMKISNHLKLGLCSGNWPLCQDHFFDALKLLHSVGHTATLVMEIERVSSTCISTILDMVKQAAECAYVCIVVADPGAALEYGGRSAREKFVCLGEMKREEAVKLLAKEGYNLRDEEVDALFAKIGTNPGTLLMLGDCEDINEAVNACVMKAISDLNAFKYKKLLKMLKNSPTGDIKLEESMFVMDCGISLDDYKSICRSTRNRDGVLFNMTTMKYSLLSTAQKTALSMQDL